MDETIANALVDRLLHHAHVLVTPRLCGVLRFFLDGDHLGVHVAQLRVASGSEGDGPGVDLCSPPEDHGAAPGRVDLDLHGSRCGGDGVGQPVVLPVTVQAIQGTPVRAHRLSRRARHGAPRRRPCTAPNDGAVSVTNTVGFSVTDSGASLPPTRPAESRCQASPLYSRLHDSHRAARRSPHRTHVNPSNSWALL
jgi:hypothetical protein